MRNAQEGSRPHRSRSRRAAFAATALLAGCSTVARDAVQVTPLVPGMAPGMASVLVIRVTNPALGTAGAGLLEAAELWNLDTGQDLTRTVVTNGRHALSAAPSRAAAAEGWSVLGPLPGRYFLRLRAAGAAAEGGQRDFTFTVPQTPGTFFIGTVTIDCSSPIAQGPGAGCRIGDVPADETAAAAAMLAAENPAAGVPVRRLVRPYPQRLAGLPAPMAPRVNVDTRLWLAAIDWSVFTTASEVPVPPPVVAPAPGEPEAGRGGSEDFAGARMTSTFIAAAIIAPMAAAAALGPILAVGVMAGAVIVGVPVGLIARAIRDDQERRRQQADARAQAEALRAAALAQEQWGPCAAGIAATLAPENVERRLLETLAPGREAGRRAALPGPWQATVSRVIFRHCGTAPDSHGVEVATRWTAQRAEDTEPVFDVAYTRSVTGAVADPRLRFSTPPPWELPVATQAACRPLAAYCGAGGSALLLREVVQGVTEARDAIMAGR